MEEKKADSIHRLIAKAIDLLIMLLFVAVIPEPVGVFFGALYILISDGLWKGQSVGKKLIGLSIERTEARSGPSHAFFRESIVRNLAFGVLLVLSCIPVVGVLFSLIFLAVLVLETYFVYADEAGIRIGDIFAGTKVVDVEPVEAT